MFYGFFPELLSIIVISKKELEAEGDEDEGDEQVGDDGGDELVHECAYGGAEQDVGDDDHDDIEVDGTRVLAGVPLEYQVDEVEHRSPHCQRVREGGRFRLGVVQEVHQKEDLVLPEGISRYVADGRGDGEYAVDGDGVA